MYDFSAIKGNDRLVRYLSGVIKNNRISHAYIFDGRPGMGKKLIAKTFAKAIQCESEGCKPCDACVSCKVFESDNHPDVVYVVPARTKSIGVDDIREQVNRSIGIKPYRYQYKIFIIDHADTMTPAAQNALLKTIEEPAGYGIFLLLSANKNLFLPTILSRCVLLSMRPLSDDIIKENLLSVGVSPELASMAAIFSDGNMGLALMIASDEKFKAMRKRACEMLIELDSMDMAKLFSLFGVFDSYRDKISEFLDIIMMWLRDAIIAKEVGVKFVLQRDMLREMTEYIANTGTKTLYSRLDAVQQARQRLAQNGNFQMTIEAMILKFRSL